MKSMFNISNQIFAKYSNNIQTLTSFQKSRTVRFFSTFALLRDNAAGGGIVLKTGGGGGIPGMEGGNGMAAGTGGGGGKPNEVVGSFGGDKMSMSSKQVTSEKSNPSITSFCYKKI